MRKLVIIKQGDRFGRFVVTQTNVSLDKYGKRIHECGCDCGSSGTYKQGALVTGDTKSCGCLNDELKRTRRPSLKHGLSRSPEYLAHKNMNDRCYNPGFIGFNHYGGRGIRVCERWRGRPGFEAFYEDLGPRPSSKHSLGRIENDGNYEPGNVEWQTRTQQGSNQSTNRIISHNGITQTLSKWARQLGMSKEALHRRITVYGWSVDRALSTPVEYRARRKRA